MEQITSFVVVAVIAIGIILLLREVTCWYLKINERIKNQEEANKLLREISRKLSISSGIEDVVDITDLKSLNLAKSKGEITQQEYLEMLKIIKK